MQRDPELIRLLMLKLEAMDKPATAIYMINSQTDMLIPDYDADKIYYHVDQILQCGWIDMAGGRGMNSAAEFCFRGLTPRGHDFVDSVRDDAIWALTKKGAAAAGGYTLDMLAALSKGLIKKQLEKLTGISVG